ncbi:MAG TPA: hypothetical protein VJS64_00815 [Pyrinomonadaceae bacterium]|nr:hypothetical protein [Pyrinomonadaceae bacterium]
MSEKVLTLFFFLSLSAISWFLVLNKGFRIKVQSGSRWFRNLSEEQKNMYDAAHLAGWLVAALAFTIVLIVTSILAIMSPVSQQ